MSDDSKASGGCGGRSLGGSELGLGRRRRDGGRPAGSKRSADGGGITNGGGAGEQGSCSPPVLGRNVVGANSALSGRPSSQIASAL
eukprot:2780084-Prymnesium_polylepis.2